MWAQTIEFTAGTRLKRQGDGSTPSPIQKEKLSQSLCKSENA